MTTTQGGPPPGWPASAVPRAAQPPSPAAAPPGADVVPVAVATELAFPPVEPGFKRGRRATIPGSTAPVGPLPAPSPPPLHDALTPTATLVMQAPTVATSATTTPVMGLAPSVGLPPAPLGVGVTPVVEVGPAAIAPPGLRPPSDAPVEAVLAPPVIAGAARPSGSRSRVLVLAIVGVVIVAGTALGSFLFLRTPSSPDTDASAAPARPSKKAKKGAAATASAHASGPVVEDTPTPDMQSPSASPDAPADASAAPSATVSAGNRLKPRLPMNRMMQKR